MDNFIYLFKYQDLFIIGAGKDLNMAKQAYRKADLIVAAKSSKADDMLKMLKKKFDKQNLPNTDYFRLSKKDSQNCANLIAKEGGKNVIEPFFKGYRLIIAFGLAWISSSVSIIKYILNPIFDNFN